MKEVAFNHVKLGMILLKYTKNQKLLTELLFPRGKIKYGQN